MVFGLTRNRFICRIRALVSATPIPTRGRTYESLKGLDEVGGAAETARRGDRRDALIAVVQHRLSPVGSPVQQIIVRRIANRIFERSDEMKNTSTGRVG